MKRFKLGLTCLALMAMSCVNAMAGTWLSNNREGGVSGAFASISPISGDLSIPLSVTDFFYNSGPTSRSGAFAGITELNDLVWAGMQSFDAFGLTIGDFYSFSSPTFGTFLGKITGENFNNLTGPGAGQRSLDFTGTFSPGSNSHYEGDTTSLENALLQISFSRNAGGTVNASWSFDTTASKPVPEPTSIAIFGLSALGLAFRRLRRM